MQRKNPAMLTKTHDGIPQQMYTGGKTNFMDRTGRHSIQQGAAARSNNSTSRGSFGSGRTPVKISRSKSAAMPSPMDILAAPRGKK